MNLQYDEIFAKFLSKVSDYSMIEQSEDILYSSMISWMKSVASQPTTRSLFSNLSFDDELQIVTFDLKNTQSDGYDIYFVTELLAKGMVVEWLEPYVKSQALIQQMVTGNREKFYSQSAHLKEVNTLLNDAKHELTRFINEYSFAYNSYL